MPSITQPLSSGEQNPKPGIVTSGLVFKPMLLLDHLFLNAMEKAIPYITFVLVGWSLLNYLFLEMVHTLGQLLSKCGTHTCGIHITWEFVRNANSLTSIPDQFCKIRNSGMWILNWHPGNSDGKLRLAHYFKPLLPLSLLF